MSLQYSWEGLEVTYSSWENWKCLEWGHMAFKTSTQNVIIMQLFQQQSYLIKEENKIQSSTLNFVWHFLFYDTITIKALLKVYFTCYYGIKLNPIIYKCFAGIKVLYMNSAYNQLRSMLPVTCHSMPYKGRARQHNNRIVLQNCLKVKMSGQTSQWSFYWLPVAISKVTLDNELSFHYIIQELFTEYLCQ